MVLELKKGSDLRMFTGSFVLNLKYNGRIHVHLGHIYDQSKMLNCSLER